MGGKTILLLLVLVAGLVALLLFTDEKPKIDTVAETMVLDGRSLGDCSRIRWQAENRVAIEVGRTEDGRFQIQEPFVDIASVSHMRSMIDAWSLAKMHQVPMGDDAAALKKAGLSPPALKLIATWPDDTRMEFAVGGKGPLGDTRLLLYGGKIWETHEAVFSSLQVGNEDLREKTVFRHVFGMPNEVRVDQVLDSGKREVLHLKVEGGAWRTLEPFAGIADPRAAQLFVTAVVSLRVDSFLLGVLEFPQRDPDIVITVRGTLGEERLDLWQEHGQVYGQIPERGVNFVSANQQYSQIFVNAANHLRARILVPMGESVFEELQELIVDPGQGRGDRLRLVRNSDNGNWRLVEPIDIAALPSPVNESCQALGRLVAREFVGDEDVQRPRAADARYGLGTTRWMVTTRRKDATGSHTLWFGGPAPSSETPLVYVCRSDEPDNVAVVDQEPLLALQRPWTTYVDRRVLRQPATIERLVLKRSDGQQRQFDRGDDDSGAWVLREGSRVEPRADVQYLANDELSDLHGKAAVDMRTDFAAEPDWTIELQRANGDELGLLRVWDRGEDRPLVVRSRSELPVGFELDPRLSKELRALWK